MKVREIHVLFSWKTLIQKNFQNVEKLENSKEVNAKIVLLEQYFIYFRKYIKNSPDCITEFISVNKKILLRLIEQLLRNEH